MKTIMQITLADVKAVMEAKGYTVLTGGHPNIVGIRNANKVSNTFDDRAFVWWDDKGKEESHYYTITTNPGFYYLENPIAGTKGTAILVPGQYLNCWELGVHRGKQKALIQTQGQVRVYRDEDKDTALDMIPATIDTGYFGINLHNAGLGDPAVINSWSAGCQVWAFHLAHEKLMAQFAQLAEAGGFKKFSYTLLMQEDFV